MAGFGEGLTGRLGVAVRCLGFEDDAGHAFKCLPGSAPSYFDLADVVRNCSAVTAACMLVPRRVFKEVDGFDERFEVAFNDVDLCLRIRQRGYLIVYTPLALRFHHECATRGRLHPPADEELCLRLWGDLIRDLTPKKLDHFRLEEVTDVGSSGAWRSAHEEAGGSCQRL